MANRVRVTLTNLDAGPRGLETARGLVMVEAGAEARAELAPGDIEAAAHSGWFVVTTSDTPRRGRRAR